MVRNVDHMCCRSPLECSQGEAAYVFMVCCRFVVVRLLLQVGCKFVVSL